MWSNLENELTLLKRECFGKEYRDIQDLLESQKGSPGGRARLQEFRELENSFLYLITLIIENQQSSGLWNVGQAFETLITAHAVRLLHQMGLSLSIRWNLAKASTSQEQSQGNLYRAADILLRKHHKPTVEHYAHWGDDLWDECYVLLALLEVQPEFDLALNNKFDTMHRESLDWLDSQISRDGFHKNVRKGAWYGLGFYAAAIELFHYHHTRVDPTNSKHRTIIDMLAAAAEPLLLESVAGTADAAQENRFAWHAGQFVVTWKEKRETYPSLAALDSLTTRLYERLKEEQSDGGAWDNKGQIGDPEMVVYYTVRALAACYAMKEDPCKSPIIMRAQRFLLHTANTTESSLLVNLKGSINAIDAYQKLFDFHFPQVYPNALLSLTGRLNQLGLLDSVQKPEAGEVVGALEKVRVEARIGLENRGKSALEILGVNDRLYSSLVRQESFLKEFMADRVKVLEELQKFLSSTLTETRSKSSRRLIKALWTTDGFLDFIPLIDHLSLLEQDGAFYKYYRDHLNHEVLLFLLGAYIYFNCATFRDNINNEIVKTYEQYNITSEDKNLSDEFLFRWKLISTFHDIGYLFEVETVTDNDGKVLRKKNELLARSFGVVQTFRDSFLIEYLMKYSRDGTLEERRQEANNVIAQLRITPYEGKVIEGPEDLFILKSADPFELISQFVTSQHVGPELVMDYFDLCRTTAAMDEKTKTIKRDSFLDHGVMSALVLLKAADIQRDELKKMNDLGFRGELLKYRPLAKVLRDPNMQKHLDAQQFYIRFSHVAGAIALHNIYPSLYNRQQCHVFDINRDKEGRGLEKAFYPTASEADQRYAISLEQNPLSYLTSLADSLQDWDRHSFRKVSFDEDEKGRDPISSSELVISFDGKGKICVLPLTDTARARYKKILADVGQYLLDWSEYVALTDETN